MTPIFKKIILPPPPHSLTPNEQREAFELPRLYEIDEEPIALKCPSCGANISAQDTKCKYCGTAFYWEKQNPSLTPKINEILRERLRTAKPQSRKDGESE